MGEFMKVLLSLSLSGTLLMLLCFLLKPLYRERFSKRWQYYIWLVAAVRFVLPFTPEENVTGYLFEKLEAVGFFDAENAVSNEFRVANSAKWQSRSGIDIWESALSGGGNLEREAWKVNSEGEAVGVNSESSLAGGGMNRISEGKARGFVSDAGSLWSISAELYSVEKSVGSIAAIQGLAFVESSAMSVLRFLLRHLDKVLFYMWLAVALFLLFRRIFAYIRFSRFVKSQCTPVTDECILGILDECRIQQKIRRVVSVSTTPFVASPMLTGFFRPCVLLPCGISPEMGNGDSKLYYTFIHELTHYRRGDLFYKWFIQAICCIHWFNPFVQLLAKETGRACELSCDEAVTSGLDREGKIAYGNTLLSFLHTRQAYASSLVSVTLTEGIREIKERLGFIMASRRKSRGRTLLTALVTLAVLLTFVTMGAYTVPGGTVRAAGDSSFVTDTAQRMAYKETQYLPEFIDLTGKYAAVETKGIGFVKDTVYWMTGKSPSHYAYLSEGKVVAYRPDTGEESILVDLSGTDDILLNATPMEDGSVVALLKSGERDGMPEYRLYKVDSEGNMVFDREYMDLFDSGLDWGTVMAADSLGRVCLRVQDALLLFNEEGEFSGEISIGEQNVAWALHRGEGKVYLYEYVADKLLPIDFDALCLREDGSKVPTASLQLMGCTDRADFLLADSVTVYRYGSEDRALVPLFDLSDSQIADVSCIEAMGEMPDGRVVLFLREEQEHVTELAILTPTPLADCPEKETLTIGVVNPGEALLKSVARFNRHSGTIRISILDYTVGGRSYQEGSAALRFDILAGNGPDLCELDCLDYDGEGEALFTDGFFADLSPWLEDGKGYGREDFLSQALDIYAYDGKLLGIPRYFTLYATEGKDELAGGNKSWDPEIRGLDSLEEISHVFRGEDVGSGSSEQEKVLDCLICGYGAYGILAESRNQDRAWEFLEYYHASQGEKNMDASHWLGFLTRRDVFEWEIEEAMIQQGYMRARFQKDGTRVIEAGGVSEDVELLYSLMENAKPLRGLGL